MTKVPRTPAKVQPKQRSTPQPTYTVGREAFARISAVEGIAPSDAARARSAEFERRGLSPAARRQEILKAYKPKA